MLNPRVANLQPSRDPADKLRCALIAMRTLRRDMRQDGVARDLLDESAVIEELIGEALALLAPTFAAGCIHP